MLKPKNIIIFIGAGAILVLLYVFFIKKSPETTGLVSTSSNPVTALTTSDDTISADANDALGTKDFLAILLNVKNIKLDDRIFSDIAFTSLRDSSIVLTPDGTEGRANPFAPIGSEGPVSSPTPAGTPKTTPAPASSANPAPAPATSSPAIPPVGSGLPSAN